MEALTSLAGIGVNPIHPSVAEYQGDNCFFLGTIDYKSGSDVYIVGTKRKFSIVIDWNDNFYSWSFNGYHLKIDDDEFDFVKDAMSLYTQVDQKMSYLYGTPWF